MKTPFAVRLAALTTTLTAALTTTPACGGGGSGLEGTWRGTAQGMSVEVKVDRDYGTAFGGTVSLGNARCFNNGPLSGVVAETSVQLASSGFGSASDHTVLQVNAERSGETLTGTLSMVGETPECNVDKAPLTLTRAR
jgi:hypothetical protein